MRLSIRTVDWLCIVSSIVLAASILPSPIRAPQSPGTRVCPNALSSQFSLVSEGYRLVVKPATPGRAFIVADGTDFDEEDEDKSSWSCSPLVSPSFILSDSPSKLHSDSRPGQSPPRTAILPLRC